MTNVTILILIDGFLQFTKAERQKINSISHNPYFNRWFSAIAKTKNYNLSIKNVTILILIDGFLQYVDGLFELLTCCSHNPYFNRWFSAMEIQFKKELANNESQSLF